MLSKIMLEGTEEKKLEIFFNMNILNIILNLSSLTNVF